MSIFSIKNVECNNRVHKVISILGIKFKFENKERTLLNALEQEKNELNKKLSEQTDKLNKTNSLLVNSQNSLKRFTPKPYLTNFVVDISHHCNLNCRGCDHFSPLAEPKFYDLDQYENDIKRLAELSGGWIDRIGIMGGEPLLNPDVIRYLEITRKYLPNTKIRLVTNGILLTKQTEEFWLALKDLNIFIEYTKYDIKLDYDKIDEIVKKYQVPIEVYGYDQEVVKTSYKIPLDLNGNQDIMTNFINCSHANYCITLKNGRLYTCTVAPNIEHFNKYFGKNIPLTERDGIDIYKANSIDEILNFLAKPIPFCKYCNVKGRTFGHEWGISKKDISEWT